MTDSAVGAPYARVLLSILAATSDDILADELSAECRARGYRLERVHGAAGLSDMIDSRRPDVLLLDLQGRLDAAVRFAGRLTSRHRGLPVVLVGESPLRSLAGFRIVDRWRAGERLVDQLELAYIGIPSSIDDADSTPAPAEPA